MGLMISHRRLCQIRAAHNTRFSLAIHARDWNSSKQRRLSNRLGRRAADSDLYICLKEQFQTKLNTPLAPTPKHRVSQTDVRRRRDRKEALTSTVSSDPVETCIGEECGQQGVCKIWMVGQVVEVGAELQLDPLCNRSHFGNG